MSGVEDRARGEERKWIHHVRLGLLKKIDDAKPEQTLYVLKLIQQEPHGLSTASLHALDGVRTNGYGHLTSGVTVLYELKRYQEEVLWYSEQLVLAAEKIDRLYDTLLADFERTFKVCSQCKGKGGAGGHGSCAWADCSNCDGRGLVKKS